MACVLNLYIFGIEISGAVRICIVFVLFLCCFFLRGDDLYCVCIVFVLKCQTRDELYRIVLFLY